MMRINALMGGAIAGLAFGIASVMGWMRPNVEGMAWLVVGLWGAWRLAGTAKPFREGFCAAVMAGLASQGIHVALYPAYAANNPEFLRLMESGEHPMSPRVFLLITAPFIAAVSGVVEGLLALAASKLRATKRSKLAAAP